MNMIAKLSSSPVDGDAVIAVLTQRLSELDARDRELTKLILGAESTPIRSGDHLASVQSERATRLLEGSERFDPSFRPPLAQIAALYSERDLVRKAMTIGQSRLHQEQLRRGAEIWSNHFDEISAIEKRRVSLACELQRLELAREELREKLQKAGAPSYLPTDGITLLDIPRFDDDVHRAGEWLVQQKVMSRREIEKVRNG